MNEDKPQTRNEDMKGLLNFGFSKYQQVKLYQKGEVIDTVKVKDMVEQKINVVSHKNLYYLSEKTNQEKFKKKIVLILYNYQLIKIKVLESLFYIIKIKLLLVILYIVK